MKKVDIATINVWGKAVGAVAWDEEKQVGFFEYEPSFLNSGLDLSPIHMSLHDASSGRNKVYSFPALNKQTYWGLPGLLADALPDAFGNNIINMWLARNGRDPSSFSAIERLCYTGKRGMGALEFAPLYQTHFDKAVDIEISELIALAQEVLMTQKKLDVQISNNDQANAEALKDILRVGTSAGGARAKAIIAMNDQGKIISGQNDAPPGFDFWILKFDGVNDIELGETRGYGRIEYAYYLMARAAGIQMSPCRLLEENGRAHFITKRFDRVNGKKLHMQSLCGLAHYDFNQAGAYSYEQAFSIMRKMRLSRRDSIEQFRRMVFNAIARNQDDHTKNIAFVMNPQGEWVLSPAFDVTYSHNPHGQWTNQHQMSINGKRAQFTQRDFIQVANNMGILHPEKIIADVVGAVTKWPEFAKEAGMNKSVALSIGQAHIVLKEI
ncbi:MAG: toxin HipA [Gammaproteobacteria bacterium]|jgi:serine/threonine-protein kinase HipA|nr:toxin HipA [Gammaproteobacteria bacterium]